MLRHTTWGVLTIGVCAAMLTANHEVLASSDKSPSVHRLRCEYQVDPLGIDVLNPRVGWAIASDRRSERQTAYQILVASSLENLAADKGDLWDSGLQATDESIHLVYQGKALSSGQRAYWKVRAWGIAGDASAFSEPAWWEMGLLRAGDWQGKWISATADLRSAAGAGTQPGAATQPAGMSEPPPAPLFRKTFELAKPIKSARAYICGLGYHELRLNGSKVGDHELDPAFTNYDHRALYVTHDVTAHLKQGRNTVGVILGNGWYNMSTREVWDFDKAPWRRPPCLLMQLNVEFEDGSRQSIVSDSTWRQSTGPIVFDAIRNGEVYDAQLEKPGWDTPVYDDKDWQQPVVVPAPRGRLVAQMMPPIKMLASVEPIKLTEPKPGMFVFDMGQNMAGRARLTVAGPAGTRVAMKYGERLAADGTVTQDQIRAHSPHGFFQTDTYVLKGSGTESWESRFVYHGFQYVEVTGFPGKPTLGSVIGRVLHTAFEQTGTFECSNKVFNQIQHATLWSYGSNFHGYPTDCPHREKNGWTGDAHMAARQAMYNFDNAASYTKWINDMDDAMKDDGMLPGIVPTAGWGYQWGNGPAWDSAYLLIPYDLYLYCGDVGILKTHYDGFKRYVDYMTSKAQDHIVSIGLGDWVCLDQKTPEAVTSTGYYYADTLILARTAQILGRREDAQKYEDLAPQIKKAFNAKFVNPQTGQVATGSQTAQACALYHGLIEPQHVEKILGVLVANIAKCDNHINSGVLGSIYIPHALTRFGRVDLAYTIAAQETYPGWGHWMQQGATTLWEDWQGKASLNHIFFGDISAWFYQALAGIDVDPDQPGFKHVIIRPHAVGDLTYAKGEVDTIRGKVVSSWRRDQGLFKLDVVIPANSTATVFLPGSDPSRVTEGGKPANEAEGIRFLRAENGCCMYHVDAGRYEFAVRMEN